MASRLNIMGTLAATPGLNHRKSSPVLTRKPRNDADLAPEGNLKLEKACADFEGIFLNQMFQTMKKTLPGDAVFGSSHQKEMYDGLFFQEISSKLARERGMGIGDALYRQLQGNTNRSERK